MGLSLAPEPTPTDERTRWYRRPVWLSVVAIVVIAVIILAIAVFAGGDDNQSSSAPTSLLPPVSNGQDGYLPDAADRFGQQVRVPRDPAGLVLPQTGVKTPRQLDDPAAGIEWQRVYDFGAAVYSTSDGPGRISADGLAEQIARTPQGSVIAASQILARIHFGPPHVMEAALAQQVIGPESAKQMLREVEMPQRQYALFRYVLVNPEYTDTFSRVSLASGPRASVNNPSETYYRATTMNMAWDNGQWKWRIPEEGFTADTGDVRIESVAGWTQW